MSVFDQSVETINWGMAGGTSHYDIVVHISSV